LLNDDYENTGKYIHPLRINQSALELVFCKLRQISPNQSIDAHYGYGDRLSRLRLTLGAFESKDSRCYDVQDVGEDHAASRGALEPLSLNVQNVRRRKQEFKDVMQQLEDAIVRIPAARLDLSLDSRFMSMDDTQHERTFEAFSKRFRSEMQMRPWSLMKVVLQQPAWTVAMKQMSLVSSPPDTELSESWILSILSNSDQAEAMCRMIADFVSAVMDCHLTVEASRGLSRRKRTNRDLDNELRQSLQDTLTMLQTSEKGSLPLSLSALTLSCLFDSVIGFVQISWHMFRQSNSTVSWMCVCWTLFRF
jgi:hypothetical protein